MCASVTNVCIQRLHTHPHTHDTSLASHTLPSPRERGSGNLAYTELCQRNSIIPYCYVTCRQRSCSCDYFKNSHFVGRSVLVCNINLSDSVVVELVMSNVQRCRASCADVTNLKEKKQRHILLGNAPFCVVGRRTKTSLPSTKAFFARVSASGTQYLMQRCR